MGLFSSLFGSSEFYSTATVVGLMIGSFIHSASFEFVILIGSVYKIIIT